MTHLILQMVIIIIIALLLDMALRRGSRKRKKSEYGRLHIGKIKADLTDIMQRDTRIKDELIPVGKMCAGDTGYTQGWLIYHDDISITKEPRGSFSTHVRMTDKGLTYDGKPDKICYHAHCCSAYPHCPEYDWSLRTGEFDDVGSEAIRRRNDWVDSYNLSQDNSKKSDQKVV